MPWINEEKCIACGICIEKCSVKAISMQAEKAKINGKSETAGLLEEAAGMSLTINEKFEAALAGLDGK